MRNLDWLYDTDEPFRNAVCGAAAEWLGSTSDNFADAWLRERHHEEDDACLLGHHMEAGEVDTREKLEANIREGSMMTIENGVQFVHAPFKSVQRWLDCQAAITECRLCKQCEWPNLAAQPDQEAYVQIVELEAFAKRLEEAAKNGDDVTLFEVDYVPAATAEYIDGWDSSSVADLLHQYENGKLMRECDIETHVLIETEELRSIAEKYRADAIAAQEERDAYRELCGRMRKVANEMLCMEVD